MIEATTVEERRQKFKEEEMSGGLFELHKCKNCKHFGKHTCEMPQKQEIEGHCYLFEYGENDYIENLHLKKYSDEELELVDEIKNLFLMKQKRDASEKIVEFIEKNNHIYTTKEDNRNEVWVYDNGIYKPNGKSVIKELSRKYLGNLYTTNLINEIINKIEADTFIEEEDFFSNNSVDEIIVENGILNIFTKELKKYSPSKIFFNKVPVKYNPSAKCEKIDNFLSQVLSKEDDKKVLYELAGFSLLKEYKFEKAIMMVGNGRNGKGKTIELLKRLVGLENCSCVPLHSLTPNSFSISELFGKFLNLAGDLSSNDLKETGLFKNLTGRDPVSVPRKFKTELKFVNYSKFVFACNDLPRVYDYSDGFWDRWLLLEFPYKFVEEKEMSQCTPSDKKRLKIRDENIINKITDPEQMSGFLNEALNGLDRLIKNKGFSYTKGTMEIKNTWIRKSDSFMAFCMDMIEESYDSRISKKDLRKNYMKYCKEHRIRGTSDKSIKATLQEMFGVSEEYTTSITHIGQEHCWVGIKWKEENNSKK